MGNYQNGRYNPSNASQQTSTAGNTTASQRTERTMNTNDDPIRQRQQLLLEVLAQIDNKEKRSSELPGRTLNSGGGVAFDWNKMPRIGSVHSVHGIIESSPALASKTNSPPPQQSPPIEKEKEPEKPANSMSKLKVSELARLILSGTFDGLLTNTSNKEKDRSPQCTTSNSVNISNSQSTVNAANPRVSNPGTRPAAQQVLNDQQLSVLADKIIGSYNKHYTSESGPRDQPSMYNQAEYTRTGRNYVRSASTGHLNTMRNVGTANHVPNTYTSGVNNNMTAVNQRTTVNQVGRATGYAYQNRPSQSYPANYRYQRAVSLNQSYQTANRPYRQPINTVNQGHVRTNSEGHVRGNAQGLGNEGYASSANQNAFMNQAALRDANLAHFSRVGRYVPSQRQAVATVHPRILSVFGSSSQQANTNRTIPATVEPTIAPTAPNHQSVRTRGIEELRLDDDHDPLACIDCLLLGICPIKKSIEAAKAKARELEGGDSDDVVITKVTTKDAEKGPIERIDVDDWAENATCLPERVNIKQEPVDDSYEVNACSNSSNLDNAPQIDQTNDTINKTIDKDSTSENAAHASPSTASPHERSGQVSIDETAEGTTLTSNERLIQDAIQPTQDYSNSNKAMDIVDENPIDFSVLTELDRSSLSKMKQLSDQVSSVVKSPIDHAIFTVLNEPSPSSMTDSELSQNNDSPLDFSALININLDDNSDSNFNSTPSTLSNSMSSITAEKSGCETSKASPIDGSTQIEKEPGSHIQATKNAEGTSSLINEQNTITDLGNPDPSNLIKTEVVNQGDANDQRNEPFENIEGAKSPETSKEGINEENEKAEHHGASAEEKNKIENESEKESEKGSESSDPAQFSYEQMLLHVMSPLDKIAYVKLQKSLEDNQKKLNKQTIPWIRKHIIRARMSFTKKYDRLRDKYKSEAIKRKAELAASSSSEQIENKRSDKESTSGSTQQIEITTLNSDKESTPGSSEQIQNIPLNSDKELTSSSNHQIQNVMNFGEQSSSGTSQPSQDQTLNSDKNSASASSQQILNSDTNKNANIKEINVDSRRANKHQEETTSVTFNGNVVGQNLGLGITVETQSSNTSHALTIQRGEVSGEQTMMCEEASTSEQQPMTIVSAAENVQTLIPNLTDRDETANAKLEEVEEEGDQSMRLGSIVCEQEEPMTLEDAIRSLDSLVPGQDTPAARDNCHGDNSSNTSINSYIDSDNNNSGSGEKINISNNSVNNCNTSNDNSYNTNNSNINFNSDNSVSSDKINIISNNSVKNSSTSNGNNNNNNNSNTNISKVNSNTNNNNNTYIIKNSSKDNIMNIGNTHNSATKEHTKTLQRTDGIESPSNQNSNPVSPPPSAISQVVSPIFERRDSLASSEALTSKCNQNTAKHSSNTGFNVPYSNVDVTEKADIFVTNVDRKTNETSIDSIGTIVNYNKQNTEDINRNLSNNKDTAISHGGESNFTRSANSMSINETTKQQPDRSTTNAVHQLTNRDSLDSLPEKLFPDEEEPEPKKSPSKRRSSEKEESESPKKTRRDDNSGASNIWELLQSKYNFD